MSMMYYPDGTDEPLRRIIAISREYGANPEYVLAGGGNTSIKDDDTLWVKASGTTLGTIDESGFVPLSRSRLAAIWQKNYPSDADQREEAVLADLMASRMDPADTRRPSVESLLHDLFPYRLVVHLHPALVNGLTCAVDGEKVAGELFGTEFVWIPVIDPGYTLAAAVKVAVEKYTAAHGLFPRIIILQNHGIFVAADDEAGIRSIYRHVFQKIQARVADIETDEAIEVDPAVQTLIAEQIEQVLPGSSLEVWNSSHLARFIADKASYAPLRRAATPDHIVYFGYCPVFVEDAAEIAGVIENCRKQEDYTPRIILVQGKAAVAVHETAARCSLAKQLFLDNLKIARLCENFGGLQFMPVENIDFIRNWEAEKYRAGKS